MFGAARGGQEVTSARSALQACASWFGAVAVFSAIVNVLYLTSSVYMMQVYDRVLASKSIPTLVAISLIVMAAYIFQGLLDGFRSKMLSRIGARFDELLSAKVYYATVELPLRGVRPAEVMTPIRDLDQIRAFLSGLGPTALFDIPFMPLFLFATFMLHPYLGWLTLAGGLAIIGLTLLTEYKSQEPARAMAEIGGVRQSMVETVRRNAEALLALGMRGNFAQRFAIASDRHVQATLRGADVTGSIGTVAKILRMALQSASLGLGAYLVIKGEMSGGAIIAASILTSRALAPIETAVAHWRGFVTARHGYRRLQETLSRIPPNPDRLTLPAPRAELEVEDLVAAIPGRNQVVLAGISLHLRAGDSLGVIGPTGGGKSTLARVVVGVWPALKGLVRIDGASLDQWGEDLGRHVGYLPQNIELFDGTIAENISRFHAEASSDSIIEAAEAAGAHKMILDLPGGYSMAIGEGGAGLSGGQKQRIALARALFGNPFLVVLDEPNANLDHEGDEALNKAIRSVTGRGGIAIIITHRPSGLAAIDRVAVIKEGRIAKIGPRDEVLAATRPPAQAGAAPARVQVPDLRAVRAGGTGA